MQGKLLIAHPLLFDGFFNRSVILITNYEEEGVAGFCLNFKTQFLLRDLRPNIKNGHIHVFEGGPVDKNNLFFLHHSKFEIPQSTFVTKNISMGGDFDELLFLIEHEKINPDELKLFAGYSGWDKEQLKEEIDRGHWLIQDKITTNLFLESENNFWKLELKKYKPELELFADFGFDVSAN